jgi:hypothetical protein
MSLWFITCDDYSIVVPALVISCNDFHCFDQTIERPMPNVRFLCNMVASWLLSQLIYLIFVNDHLCLLISSRSHYSFMVSGAWTEALSCYLSDFSKVSFLPLCLLQPLKVYVSIIFRRLDKVCFAFQVRSTLPLKQDLNYWFWNRHT